MKKQKHTKLVILAVPIIPTGFAGIMGNGHSGFPWGILILLLVAIGIFLYLFLTKRKNQTHDDDDMVLIQLIGFVSDDTKSSEDDLIRYMLQFAKFKEFPNDDGNKVQDLFLQHFEQIRLGYVYETSKTLMINDLPRTVQKATIKFIRPSESHTSKDGERLNLWERFHLITEGTCPDCDTGKLVEVPHDGLSINYECENPKCGSRFNLSVVNGSLAFADRISDASPKKPK